MYWKHFVNIHEEQSWKHIETGYWLFSDGEMTKRSCELPECFYVLKHMYGEPIVESSWHLFSICSAVWK